MCNTLNMSLTLHKIKHTYKSITIIIKVMLPNSSTDMVTTYENSSFIREIKFLFGGW